MPGFKLLGQVIQAEFATYEKAIDEKLDVIRKEQKSVEEQLADLEQGDPSGLMQLIKYSRLQLEAYYTIGLRQTQQSFRNSVVAMWLGFAIILVGLLRHVLPLNDFVRSWLPLQRNSIS